MKPNAYELAYNSECISTLKMELAFKWSEVTYRLLSPVGSLFPVVEELYASGKACYLLEELSPMDNPPVPRFVVDLMSAVWAEYQKYNDNDIPF